MELKDQKRNFQKQLSEMLIALRTAENLPMEQGEDSFSSESEAETEAEEESTKQSAKYFLGESVLDLSLGGTPLLLQLLGSGSGTIQKQQLNAILLEIFSLMGNKSNSVDFVYKNGHKGRAIIVPQVKSQDSFMLQAKRISWIETLLEHIAAGNEDVIKKTQHNG
jgi:hypothetical protein